MRLGEVVEQDVVPIGPYRMPPAGRDRVLRRGPRGELIRLIHLGPEPAVVAAWPAGGAVRIHARGASREAAAHAVARMRFALGLDHDLSEFHAAFRRDRLIGSTIRQRPWLRPRRRPEPFEALAWASTEQLIDGRTAEEIQRRLVQRYGPRSACRRLRSVPTPAVLAGRSPVELEACGLSHRRALALVKAAREVAAGRADLREHERAWARLRRIPTIGSWTLECLAFHGQGRDDQLPAGDLAFVKLVGRLLALGRRASEHEVREFFEPYAPFQALAGTYMVAGRFGLPAARPVA
jgi:3-methyladenine DNA glycosylase/8-oxoguanine DNA glycosylase